MEPDEEAMENNIYEEIGPASPRNNATTSTHNHIPMSVLFRPKLPT